MDRKTLAILGIILLVLARGAKFVIDRITLEKIRKRWGPMIRKYASIYGVPEDLITAIIYVESRGNPRAVSDIGAAGLMQVWWPAALQVGEIKRKEEFSPSEFLDPERNIKTGVAYLDWLRSWFFRKHGRMPTFQEWARMYYGGPFGYRKPQTLEYGQRVVAVLKEIQPV